MHRLQQRDPAQRRLGQISGAQSLRRKGLQLQPRHGATPFADQIDRLRRERLILRDFQSIDRPKDRPLLDVGPLQLFAQHLDRRADQKHPALIVRVTRLGSAEVDSKAW